MLKYWFCKHSKWVFNICLVKILQLCQWEQCQGELTHFSSTFLFPYLYHINKQTWCSSASNICRKKKRKKIATTHTSWNIIVEKKMCSKPPWSSGVNSSLNMRDMGTADFCIVSILESPGFCSLPAWKAIWSHISLHILVCAFTQYLSPT